MKVEELMIDDWVYIGEPDDFHGYIAKVVIINGETGYITVHIPDMHLHDVFVEDLQPIQLTSEILEKNKFPYAPKASGYFVGDLFLKGNVDIGYSCGVNIRTDNGDRIVSGIYYTFTKIHYVHELQHLLKLCKIEKEIVL